MFLFKLSNIVKELFLVIFVTKWVFKKPKKANILIYDDESIENLEFFLKGKKFEIFHVRHEILNIYVLINSILKNGFYKVRENYKLTFFTIVDPKLVITLIDENPGFFKLKSLSGNKSTS